jgi:hypothetical protein
VGGALELDWQIPGDGYYFSKLVTDTQLREHYAEPVRLGRGLAA